MNNHTPARLEYAATLTPAALRAYVARAARELGRDSKGYLDLLTGLHARGIL